MREGLQTVPVFVRQDCDANIIGYARTEQEALATYARHFGSEFTVLMAQQVVAVQRELIDGWIIRIDDEPHHPAENRHDIKSHPRPTSTSQPPSRRQHQPRTRPRQLVRNHLPQSIEVFSAGCLVCEEAVEAIKQEVCQDCEVIVLDMQDAQVARRAKDLGVRSVPAVAIDGKLASCCSGRGIDMQVLRDAGLGRGRF
jgi:glutaredoxin 3